MKTRPQDSPGLQFSPLAWAKLLFLRDYGPTEVGAFGVSPAEDLLYVQDVHLVRQVCTPVSVEFDDAAVADFFDQQVDLGRRPEQFARLWLHTHPGACPRPSVTDEHTLARVFGNSDWAVMFILAREGPLYARLRFNVGPGADLELAATIDYGRPFAGCDRAAWEAEYRANVTASLGWDRDFRPGDFRPSDFRPGDFRPSAHHNQTGADDVELDWAHDLF